MLHAVTFAARDFRCAQEVMCPSGQKTNPTRHEDAHETLSGVLSPDRKRISQNDGTRTVAKRPRPSTFVRPHHLNIPRNFTRFQVRATVRTTQSMEPPAPHAARAPAEDPLREADALNDDQLEAFIFDCVEVSD